MKVALEQDNLGDHWGIIEFAR